MGGKSFKSSIKRQRSLNLGLTYAGLLGGLVFAVFPVFWMLVTSIRQNIEVFAVPPRVIPQKITGEAYEAILFNPVRLRFFFNSYFVALMVSFLSILAAIPAGYGFSRFFFKGKKVFHLFIISTQTIPPITLLIPYFGMIVAFRIYNTYYALIFTYLALTLPYAVLMMTGYFNTIPRELDEAVLIDGASRFYALWKVLVPISIPGVVATGIYTFLLSWNEFLFALTLTKSAQMRTVPIGIQQMMGEHAFQWNEMMAMSLLGCLPILLVYLFAQKYFLAGMTAGSVKT
jgi:multiple sugar transport system permease protein